MQDLPFKTCSRQDQDVLHQHHETPPHRMQQQQQQQQQMLSLQQQQLAMPQHQIQMQQQALQLHQLQQRKLQISQQQQDLFNATHGISRPLSAGHPLPKVENATPQNGLGEEVNMKPDIAQIMTKTEDQVQDGLMKCSVKVEVGTDDCKDHTMTESKAEEMPGISDPSSAHPSPAGSAPTPCSDLSKSEPGALLPAAGASTVTTLQAKLPVNKKGI